MITRLGHAYRNFRRGQRNRNALECLSDHQLADIGLIRSDIDGFVRRSTDAR